MTFSYKCSCAGDELSVILNSQAIAAAQTLIRLLGPEFTSYQQVKYVAGAHEKKTKAGTRAHRRPLSQPRLSSACWDPSSPAISR